MSKNSIITDTNYLLHPERLSRDELLETLEMLCVKVASNLSTDKIIEIFKKVALPLPPRTTNGYHDSLVRNSELWHHTSTDMQNRCCLKNLERNICKWKMKSENINDEIINGNLMMDTSLKTKRIKINRLSFTRNNVKIEEQINGTMTEDICQSIDKNMEHNLPTDTDYVNGTVDKTLKLHDRLNKIFLDDSIKTDNVIISEDKEISPNYDYTSTATNIKLKPTRVVLKRSHLLKNDESMCKKIRL